MQLRSRTGLALTAIVVVLVVVGIIGAYYLTVFQPPFVAKLTMIASGTVPIYDNVTSPYVNLSLTFTSPASLDPASLVISLVCRSTCPVFPTSTSTNATSLDLTYDANMYPHWVARPSGTSYWSGANAVATNPDGILVGGSPPSWASTETSVQSGAVFNIVLPGVYPDTFSAIRMTYEGHLGTAEIPLA